MKTYVGYYDGTMTEEDLDLILATHEQDGLMSKEDKIKLDTMIGESGGSTPIESITADKVVQDASHRFVTDVEKTTWNSKASNSPVSTNSNGLMTKEDKVKLDKIPDDAKFTDTVYTHPDTHPATMITQDTTHRFVSDAEKATWNNKPNDKIDLGLGNVTNDAQVKRSEMGVPNGVATLDAEGKIPAVQLPSYVDDVLEFDTKDVFPVKGEEGKIYLDKSTNISYRWSGSRYAKMASDLALGETSATAYAGDKGKAVTEEVNKIKSGVTVVPKAADAATITGFTVGVNVPANAKFTDTVYTHPDTHPATMITEDTTHKFVSDDQIAKWDAKADNAVVTNDTNGLMSKEDKSKLDGIATGANNYTHPVNHPATMITEDTTHKFVSDDQIAKWDAKADNILASDKNNGLMSNVDKAKLDGLLTMNLCNSLTITKGQSFVVDEKINFCRVIALFDTEHNVDGTSINSVPGGFTARKTYMFKTSKLNPDVLEYVEHVYLFEIVDKTHLLFKNGMKITYTNNTVKTEEITTTKIYMMGSHY